MYRKICIIAACIAALSVLQLKANVEPPGISVTLHSPTAVLLGTDADFVVTVDDTGAGGSGKYWYNWSIDTYQSGNIDDDNTYTYAVPTGDENAKKVTVNVTVTDQEDETLTDSTSVEMWQVQVTLQGVDAADELFVEEGQTYYATARSDAANVTVSLQVQPENANLPNDFIGWSGGQSTGNQLQRVLSRSTLQNDGVEIRATNNENTLFNSRIFVFQEKPEISPATLWAEPIYYPNLPVGHDRFGAYGIGVYPCAYSCVVYYENKNWKFELTHVTFSNKWNIQSLGRTDVPSDFTPYPAFPLGYNMNDPIYTTPCSNNTHYIARREKAREDLMPDNTSEPKPPRNHYWVSHLSEQHEKFHLDDWAGKEGISYLPDVVDVAELYMRNKSIALTPSMIKPEDAFDAYRQVFRAEINNWILYALDIFYYLAEPRAYTDGKQAYIDLVNSIE